MMTLILTSLPKLIIRTIVERLISRTLLRVAIFQRVLLLQTSSEWLGAEASNVTILWVWSHRECRTAHACAGRKSGQLQNEVGVASNISAAAAQ